MAAKIAGDIVKPFSGDGDIVAWLKKVELVAKLQKVDDLALFIPLFLEGDALALYLELSSTEQKDAKKIQTALTTAFADSPVTAYGNLAKYRWTGEQVDVFANEIRRLAGLAGFKDDGLEQIVKLAFIDGFPDDISVSLQRDPDILENEMSSIIARARILTAKRHKSVAAVVKPSDNQASGERDDKSFKGRCFKCNGPHMARFCKEKVVCFRCNKPGHVVRDCDQPQGNC